MNLFHLHPPTTPRLPIVANLPHSGIYVPEEIKKLLTDDLREALYHTDWYLQELYDFLPELGITMLEATHNRYVVDLNRNPTRKLYGPFFSAVIAANTPLKKVVYKTQPSEKSLKKRIECFHQPYHQQLQALIDDLKSEFEQVTLVDLHSFMGIITEDVCLGNGNGDTCSEALMKSFDRHFQNEGFQVVQNKVFTGGYNTRHYGRQADVEALQIEIRHPTYLAETELDLPRMPQIVDKIKFSQTKKKLRSLFENVLAELG